MVRDETGILHAIHVWNAVLLGLLSIVGWYIYSWPYARSIIIGGLLAGASFFLLSRDIRKLVDSYAGAGEKNRSAVKRAGKVRMLLNFYVRLGVIGLILYELHGMVPMHMTGLAIGLSTVMCSVIIVVLRKGNTLYSVQSCKGA